MDMQFIRLAAQRLENVAVYTPLLENATLNAHVGARVFLKAETLQHGGSFKFRGAYNKLVQLAPDIAQKGVIAWSSGNHAQGVARAAQMRSIPATIVMPHDAPAVKTDATKALGANIHFYDRYTEDREKIGRTLAAEAGATLVPSYDDIDIIAGQGTVGLEMVVQLKERNVVPDMALICCGGGGLCAGSSLALHDTFPDLAIYSVEPESFDDTRRSLLSRAREGNDPDGRSICDALLSPTPGELTFPILQSHGVSGLTVSDQEARQAVHYAWKNLKLVVEPSGAVTLAALLSGKLDVQGKTVCITLSGGNVDLEMFTDCLKASLTF